MFWEKARQKINQTVVQSMSCKSLVDVHKSDFDTCKFCLWVLGVLSYMHKTYFDIEARS